MRVSFIGKKIIKELGQKNVFGQQGYKDQEQEQDNNHEDKGY